MGVRTLRWEMAPDKANEYVFLDRMGQIITNPDTDGLGAF